MKKGVELIKRIWIIAAIFAVVSVMYIFRLECPFLAIFGVPCPGCGMTRAYISLFCFDFVSAVKFHSLFWTVPILFVYVLFDGDVFGKKRLDMGVVITIGILFIVRWLYVLSKIVF